MNATAGGGEVVQQRALLRREVLVPVPSYRRASYLVGLGVLLVLVASAIDAVVWTYHSQRRLWRQEAAHSMRLRPPADGDASAHRFENRRREARMECPHWRAARAVAGDR